MSKLESEGWGSRVVIRKESAFASFCKNTEAETRNLISTCEVFVLQRGTCLGAGGVREHFAVLLLDLCLETGSLFGPLYLLGPLAIYLKAQSAVCNITVSCRGDRDVSASASWL